MLKQVGVSVVVLAALVAFASSSTGTSVASGPHLTSPATAPFGISLPSTRSDQAYTVGGIPVCLDRPGNADIDGISLVAPKGGLTVSAFAARPLGTTLFGAENIELSRTGFDGRTTVSQSCGQSPGGAELAVEFRKTTNDNARADGILVKWHNNDAQGQVSIPLHIVFCEGPNENITACQSFPPQGSSVDMAWSDRKEAQDEIAPHLLLAGLQGSHSDRGHPGRSCFLRGDGRGPSGLDSRTAA